MVRQQAIVYTQNVFGVQQNRHGQICNICMSIGVALAEIAALYHKWQWDPLSHSQCLQVDNNIGTKIYLKKTEGCIFFWGNDYIIYLYMYIKKSMVTVTNEVNI